MLSSRAHVAHLLRRLLELELREHLALVLVRLVPLDALLVVLVPGFAGLFVLAVHHVFFAEPKKTSSHEKRVH